MRECDIGRIVRNKVFLLISFITIYAERKVKH